LELRIFLGGIIITDKKASSSIILKEHLDVTVYEQITKLQDSCSKVDKTSLKLELDYKSKASEGSQSDQIKHINEFLYYNHEKLVGYMGICSFGGSDLEVNGMVHPDYRRRGIFTKLFQLVKEEWTRRRGSKMLLLSDSQSASGTEFLKTTGAEFEFAEYEMYLDKKKTVDKPESNIVLRKATNADALEIARQNKIYFGDVHEEISEESSENVEDKAVIMPEDEEKRGMLIYIAEVDNEIVGKVHLEVNKKLGGIYGLGVLPAHRRKGYGRELLIKSVENLLDRGCDDVMLQVVTENKKALDLYLDCGFKEVSTMNYYHIKKAAI